MEQAPYNYMQRVTDLFDTLQNAGVLDDDKAVIDAVILNKDIVIEIGENVQTAPAFVSHRDQFDSFCQSIETQIEDRRERLTATWNHFIERTANAPTQAHLATIVIMTFPAISKYLLDYVANPDPLKPSTDEV